MKLMTHLFGRGHSSGWNSGFVEAQRRVLDYARFLEDSPPMPGRVIDASRLPHSKEDLKAALLMCISNIGDARLQQHLRHGYLMLSAFQQDVGEDLGADFAALDLGADPLAVATVIEEAEASAHPWQMQVQAELGRLQRDLDQLELRLSEPARLFA